MYKADSAEEIISKSKNFIGEDVIGNLWYECPDEDCRCQTILCNFEYCPKCGSLLKWIK